MFQGFGDITSLGFGFRLNYQQAWDASLNLISSSRTDQSVLQHEFVKNLEIILHSTLQIF